MQGQGFITEYVLMASESGLYEQLLHYSRHFTDTLETAHVQTMVKPLVDNEARVQSLHSKLRRQCF